MPAVGRLAWRRPACRAQFWLPTVLSPKPCMGSVAPRGSRGGSAHNNARGLVARYFKILPGGYRLLLHYPVRASGK